VNDWLLKINDVDLTNKDKKQVIKAVLNGGGVINMVVRRRKSLGGKVVTPLHINLSGHKDSGIGLENGIFVATIMSGSPAAKEGSLTVGDRIIAINGIALDNKSLTECEALLRNCRESLMLSLMKVYPQSSSSSWSGQNIFENLKDSEKISNGRVHASEVQAQNKRNLKHNSSTQTDIFNPDIMDVKKDQSDQENGLYCSLKPFSGSVLHGDSHRNSVHECHSNSEHSLESFGPDGYGDPSYGIVSLDNQRLSFDPTVADCIVLESALDKGVGGKHSGGTWPKVVVNLAPAETEKFSVYKKPKQRKSIFDPDTFKRPLTPPKMDYLSPNPMLGLSVQTSKPEAISTPPTPPTRSDSIKFKHKQQASSASESTVTMGSSPPSPAAVQPPLSFELKPDSCLLKGRGRPSGHYYREEGVDPGHLPSRKSCEEDLGFQRVEEPETSEELLSPEVQEWPTYSPKRASRHSDGFVSASLYAGSLSGGTVPRNIAPCSAVTAVMRNPVYTAWSHRIATTNCSLAANQYCHQHLHPSTQHQGHLSLDLSHKHTSECSENTRSRSSHGSNSLPSSARLGSSSNLQYRTERIKIPLTPRYPRSIIGSDRGSLSQSECSSPSLVTPPQSPLNLETSSFASSQSQNSLSTLPRISVSPVSMGQRRKDKPYMEEPRQVKVQKGAEPLGISIVCGENGGIFFNGINLRNATEQQARLIIGQQCDTITILAQYNPHMFQLGNHSRSRALYDRLAEVEQDLSFKKDDILYVDDTLPQGNFGCWMAWQLDENAQKLERGQIPSKYIMEQEFYRRHSMSEAKDENSSSKATSAAARRSFFRRKHKHKRSGSKDGKDLLALDTISTDSIPFLDGKCVFWLKPNKPWFVFVFQTEVMKASQQAIERGVKDCLFIDYKRRSGHFDVTTVASIKEITEKDCHCLLDIAPHAIERLHSIHIYPIVIFVRYKNAKQIKEQKDPVFLKDKVTQKHSKEQFETAQKIEQEYSKYFTGVVQGGPLSTICTQIMTTVDQEQNKVLWIPAGPP
ncbi:Disks large-like 5, partial [Ophiophagus hannah]